MEVHVPVVENFLGQVFRADQLREVLAGKGEITAIDLAQQVLPADRHVLRVTGTEIVMTLVGTGTAFYAGIQVHLQRAVLAQQIAHRVDGLVVPVVDQLAGKVKRLLELRFGDKGLAVRHRTGYDRRHLGKFFQLRDFKICFCHAR